MDERDRSRSPSRRTSRVEQVVGRWLRRSRDSTSRERVIEDGRAADASPHEQRSCSIRLTAQIPFDSALNTHGFTVSTHTPPQVQEVTAGGPADGKLLPGDQLVKINNVAVDDLSAEQAADIIRECQDTVTMTVLRITVGPKSSFITPEKRAKLKSNPVKVHFAEEVVVNGHSQGNSLLFLPNVLKVYLENGQTKAFKFEPKTTVKDIVMTLKEKLSLSRIEHFSLVLEQQYSIAKLFLLHEEELIQEVVQKKESHDYRCLFRVCFIPKEPSDMLEEDPIAFEYLYLQSVGDVLQERFAVEMKCNTALRLAALHIQERLASNGQPLKTPLKTVTKEWGIESFVSSTLLRNMREKDLRKAISYHMKKILVQEPKQKVVTVNQARLNYLNEMSELKTYGGKSFSATMMLQDRESMVSLLVGAQYGVSQVINHKLSIMTTLTEFSSITRVELTPESDRVSLVKIYLQDIKPLTLLLESVAAKDLSCLIAGYCKLMVDPQICVFPWTTKTKGHRISAEEGYVSRCGSESEDSDTDLDALIAHVAKATKSDQQEAAEASNYRASSGVEQETETTETKKEDQNEKQVQLANGIDTKIVRLEEQTNSCVNVGKSIKIIEVKETEEKEDTNGEKETKPPCVIIVDDPPSEASDSCQTDSRFLTSMSSDSMDALEEDDLLTYCSTGCPSHLDVEGHYLHVDPSLLSPSPKQTYCQDTDFHNELGSDFDGDSDPFVCFAALSSIAECLPSPPEASEDEDCEDQGAEVDGQRPETSEDDCERAETTGENVFTFEQGDTRCYYNICSNVTPDSAHSLPRPPTPPVTQKEQRENGQDEERETEPAPILQPPPGFGDSSSDDEFFDAQERFTSPEEPSSAAMAQEISTESTSMKRTLSLSDIGICFGEQETTERDRMGEKAEDLQVEMENDLTRFRKRSRKRRSFMETDYTSLVSFPEEDQTNNCNQIPNHQSGLNNRGEGLFSCFDGGFSDQSPCPTVSSLTGAEGEPAQLESKPITPSKQSNSGTRSLIESNKMSKASQRKQQLMLMEPDSMEFKSVTELVSNVPPAITASRTCVDLKGKENNIDSTDGEEESAVEGSVEGFLADHLFFAKSRRNEGDKTFNVKMNNQDSFIGLSQGTLDKLKTCSLSRLGQTPLASSLFLQVPTISCSQSLGVHSDEKSLEMGIQKGPVEPVERSRSQSMSAAFGRRTPLSSQRHLFAQRESLFQSKDPDHDDLDTSSDPSIQELSSSVPSMELNQGYLLTPCSTGILGRLSASTLRGKIQNLPLYLSRSQEVLDGNTSICGNTKPARRFSETRTKRKEVEVVNEESEEMTSAEKASEVTEVKVVTIVSEEVTEVIEEVREVNHKNSQGHGQQKTKTEPQGPPQAFNSPSCPQSVAPVKVSPSSVVVTTQNLNGPWGVVASPEIGGLQGGSSPLVDTHSHHLASGCGVFTNCESKPTSTQPKALPSPCPHGKPDLSCSSALAMGCERVMDGAQTPLEVCGCQAVYTNCFSGVLDSGSFDDELTVYEFSCRTQPEASDQAAQMTTAPPSFLSDSPASFSPSSPLPPFPRVVLPPSSSAELGPLLSPLHAHDCFLSDPHEDTIAALLSRHYPLPPTGFLALQRDVDTLLTVLAGAMKDQDGVQEHLRDNCAAHFSENKQKLHAEARGLLTGCQQVVRVGQTPAETLEALVESFHSLVQLTSVCLSFSSCQRCRERHTQALSGLADLAQTYQEFALAAERVGITTGKRTCHDLSIKLLARQCTALTTSVFCLTQLFRTLTAL